MDIFVHFIGEWIRRLIWIVFFQHPINVCILSLLLFIADHCPYQHDSRQRSPNVKRVFFLPTDAKFWLIGNCLFLRVHPLKLQGLYHTYKCNTCKVARDYFCHKFAVKKTTTFFCQSNTISESILLPGQIKYTSLMRQNKMLRLTGGSWSMFLCWSAVTVFIILAQRSLRNPSSICSFVVLISCLRILLSLLDDYVIVHADTIFTCMYREACAQTCYLLVNHTPTDFHVFAFGCWSVSHTW